MTALAEPSDADGDSRRASRRAFLGVAAGLGAAASIGRRAYAAPSGHADAVASFLRARVVPRETIDRFLDPRARIWARYHTVYGYLLRDSFLRDGIDGARSLARYEATGQRKQVNFADAPCRINTYGDSFTQGHQVSDGETWQEVLAAHFCEPIRNFGIGGFGVYQACRRMREVESGPLGAPYVVLNLWGDDQHRSIYAWRWLSFPDDALAEKYNVMFHSNPWDHVRLSDDGRSLVEHRSACPTPESLYKLCDADWVVERFGDDEVTHALVAFHTGRVADEAPIARLADACGTTPKLSGAEAEVRVAVWNLLNDYALRAGALVIDGARDFVASKGKKLYVLLSHPRGSVWRHCEGKSAVEAGDLDWHPAWFQERLRESGLPVLDTVAAHVADFASFRCSAQEYVERYFIGHYSPVGNNFFAYAVKDSLRDWLDPLPPAYADAGAETLIRFDGYLPD
ncbi:MAG: hypothetical protein ACRCT8_01865 [Lacipirellulaceae bacterium]